MKTNGLGRQTRQRHKNSHAEILNQAAIFAPDLIVVGSTAIDGFTRFLLGSTAEQAVRHASCSVFVARREHT